MEEIEKILHNLLLKIRNNNLTPLQAEREFAKGLCLIFFKDDYGKPFELTDGQADIFNVIWLKRDNRNQIETYTQYGKSEVVAMALDLTAIVTKENYMIVAGQQKKTDIIMGKCIKHLFDHPLITKQIDPLSIPPLERLKHRMSQEKVTFVRGGAIETLTASAQNRQRVKDVVTGQGSKNVIADEAPLIPDDLWSMIMRMLGGFKDNFLVKIGNPFYRNHFYRSHQNSKYKKIIIDYKQGLREGRITEDFIEEMRQELFFDILYEVKFPAKDEYLSDGFRQLIPDEMIESAFISEEEAKELDLFRGNPKLGGDFAGGGNDRSAYTARWPKVAKLLGTNRIADTMQQIPILEDIMRNNSVESEDTNLDYGGLGQGIVDRMHEKEYYVNGIQFGSSSPDPDKHKNMRAYMYMELYNWLKEGGRIVKDDSFYELSVINYKEDSERKFQIQPKVELRKIAKKLQLSINSPDVADSLALTFASDSEMMGVDDIG